MRRRTLVLLAAAAAISLTVAVQVLISTGRPDPVARAGMPTVSAGADVLSGITVIPQRVRGYDYRRPAFGDAWDDDTAAPGGRNGCDTRNDILNRDLADKTYVAIQRCPRVCPQHPDDHTHPLG